MELWQRSIQSYYYSFMFVLLRAGAASRSSCQEADRRSRDANLTTATWTRASERRAVPNPHDRATRNTRVQYCSANTMQQLEHNTWISYFMREQ